MEGSLGRDRWRERWREGAEARDGAGHEYRGREK